MTAVLDHGEVLLVDSMAADAKVVGAARISTGKVQTGYTSGFGPEQAEKDRKLINYLMSNGHGTPFEHAVFQFYVKAPIFVVREWQRHRVASYNEFSMRYAEVTDEAEFYIPGHIREQDPANKQSSVIVTDYDRAGYVANNIDLIKQETELAFSTYRGLLSNGVAREMARLVLTVNVYTKFWFTVNARSLMNFLMLRNAPSAQWEIQQYAQALEWFFKELMPETWAAFNTNGRRAP